jgi:hypothetical protein
MFLWVESLTAYEVSHCRESCLDCEDEDEVHLGR